MTSCSLRRLQEHAAQRDDRDALRSSCARATKESERASISSEFQSNRAALGHGWVRRAATQWAISRSGGT